MLMWNAESGDLFLLSELGLGRIQMIGMKLGGGGGLGHPQQRTSFSISLEPFLMSK